MHSETTPRPTGVVPSGGEFSSSKSVQAVADAMTDNHEPSVRYTPPVPECPVRFFTSQLATRAPLVADIGCGPEVVGEVVSDLGGGTVVGVDIPHKRS